MPNPPPPPTPMLRAFRRVALAAQLRMFPPGWWLLLECGGCGNLVHVPLRRVWPDGERVPLGEIVIRLRCRQCQAVPASVLLTDDAQANGVGGPPDTWLLPLLPDPEA